MMTTMTTMMMTTVMTTKTWDLFLAAYLLLGLFHDSTSNEDKIVCFRKFDHERSACKGLIAHKDDENVVYPITSKSCCHKYGQGFARQILRVENRKKWFECDPCRNESRTPSSAASVYEKDGDRRHQESPGGDDGAASNWMRKLDTPMLDDNTREADNDTFSGYSAMTPKSLTQSNVTLSADDWSPWSDWSPCSQTCGIGVQKRRRFCLSILCGEEFQERACTKEIECSVDGGWSDWDDWQPCSVTCGIGTRIRQRTCNNPTPSNGGKDCDGLPSDEQPCQNSPCRVDGQWSSWSLWSVCSVTCGQGEQVRTRSCDNPSPDHGGDECGGQSEERRDCDTITCPVNGGWSVWNKWSNCSATCGEGSQVRYRLCDSPIPSHGGQPCEGLKQESMPCVTRINCPVDGNWTEWSKWDICSAKPCSGQLGHRVRYRTCTNPQPMFGGRTCKGRTWSRQPCYSNDFCTQPVDGKWCEWLAWTECESSIQTRTRLCECPPALNGGTDCSGGAVEERSCEMAYHNQTSTPSTTTKDVPKSEIRKNCPGDGSGDGSEVSCDQEMPDAATNPEMPYSGHEPTGEHQMSETLSTGDSL